MPADEHSRLGVERGSSGHILGQMVSGRALATLGGDGFLSRKWQPNWGQEGDDYSRTRSSKGFLSGLRTQGLMLRAKTRNEHPGLTCYKGPSHSWKKGPSRFCGRLTPARQRCGRFFFGHFRHRERRAIPPGAQRGPTGEASSIGTKKRGGHPRTPMGAGVFWKPHFPGGKNRRREKALFPPWLVFPDFRAGSWAGPIFRGPLDGISLGVRRGPPLFQGTSSKGGGGGTGFWAEKRLRPSR